MDFLTYSTLLCLNNYGSGLGSALGKPWIVSSSETQLISMRPLRKSCKLTQVHAQQDEFPRTVFK